MDVASLTVKMAKGSVGIDVPMQLINQGQCLCLFDRIAAIHTSDNAGAFATCRVALVRQQAVQASWAQATLGSTSAMPLLACWTSPTLMNPRCHPPTRTCRPRTFQPTLTHYSTTEAHCLLNKQPVHGTRASLDCAGRCRLTRALQAVKH